MLMVVREKGWRIHGEVCEEWDNVFVFVRHCNEKMVEGFDVFFFFVIS
jgi:hypothetical protein